MPSIEYSIDLRDIFYVLFEQIDIEKKLLTLPEFQEFDRDTLELIVQEAAKFAVQEVAPINREGDLQEVQFNKGEVRLPESFKRVYHLLRETGSLGLQCNPEWGGQGLPEIFGSIFSELITGANTSFALMLLLNHGAGHLIESFGSEELKTLYCEKMYNGEWGGTMCLTEAQAGSDLSSVSTIAEPNGDHYLIRGNKIFITNGDHDLTSNIIHAVLARVPGAPAGTKGISLFVVPKYLINPDGSIGEFNDVRCERIEHKMGIKASPTCVLSFGDEGKCKGWLLGELNRGMPQMFQMMNEARLGVGIQGLANAAAAYMSALGYSLERKQGSDISKFKDPQAPRVEIVMHPDVRRMLITMKAYVEGMRAMLYHTATYIDLAKHHADEEARELYNNLVELLTPVCKAYASDMGFRVCELAVQTYGGYGYTQEYPVELYLRDAKIASIYEGTNGIQAMDLFARKIGQNKGLRLMQFGKFVTKHIARWQEHALGELTMPLNRALNDLTEVSLDLLTAASSGDMVHGLLHATPYLEMFGNFATAFYLVEAAVIAHDKLHQLYAQEQLTTNEAQEKFLQQNSDAAFYHSKICTARFFIHHILSKNIGFAESIRAHDRSPIDVIFPNT